MAGFRIGMDCLVCRSNEGVERISPGAPIYDGTHWVVEHAYPTALLGWLVIVAKRHVEALHELSREEGEELGLLQRSISKALHPETRCLKEYSILFAEQPRFSHLHVHLVPRSANMDPERMGSKAFSYLKPEASEVIPASDVVALCKRVGSAVHELMAE